MISGHTTMTNPMPTTIPAGGSSTGKIMIGLAIAVAIGAFFYFDLGRFLSLNALQENRDHMLAFTEANYATAVGLFVLAYIAVTGLSRWRVSGNAGNERRDGPYVSSASAWASSSGVAPRRWRPSP